MADHSARSPEEGARLIAMRWRVGGSVGRTIYAEEGWHYEHAREGAGVLIGVMDSAELAARVVAAHNALIEWEEARR